MDSLKLEALIAATFTNSDYVSGVRTLFDVLRPGHETKEVYKLISQIMRDHGVPYPAKTLVAT